MHIYGVETSSITVNVIIVWIAFDITCRHIGSSTHVQMFCLK